MSATGENSPINLPVVVSIDTTAEQAKYTIAERPKLSAVQYELNPPPSDKMSSLAWGPGASTKLLVGSWDKHVYLYDAVNAQPSDRATGNDENNGDSGERHLIRTFKHRACVLDVCFGDNEDVAYTCGLDWDVRKLDLKTGKQTVLSSHTMAASRIAYSPTHKILVSSSWDKTIHIHHTDPSTPASRNPATIEVPVKPIAIALSASKLIITMVQRQVLIYDLNALSMATSESAKPFPNVVELEPFQRRESSLKFLTRTIACMPNDEGFASGSIEGRVAVDWFDGSPESQARKYAFKCHRQPINHPETGEEIDMVYPLNSLAFHPMHGTFVSGGGDGFVALWDAAAKRRIRQYQRYPAAVAALRFSGDGKYLAVGVCPELEQGFNGEDVFSEGPVKVFIRVLAENEAKGKGK